MSDFHSADIQPSGDKLSHHLLINGVTIARFNELKKALAARSLLIEQSLAQQQRRIEPGDGEAAP